MNSLSDTRSETEPNTSSGAPCTSTGGDGKGLKGPGRSLLRRLGARDGKNFHLEKFSRPPAKPNKFARKKKKKRRYSKNLSSLEKIQKALMAENSLETTLEARLPLLVVVGFLY